MIYFEIPGEPVSKGRPRFRKVGKFIQIYTPKKTKSYENLVKKSWKERSNVKLPDGVPLIVNLVFVFEPPKSWSKKKQEECLGKPHISRPDLDNIIKSVLDGLKGEAFTDDNVISMITAKKIYGKEAKVVVRIWAADET